MVAGLRLRGWEERKRPPKRRPKTGRGREVEEANKVEVAPRLTVASLRRFRAALIEPTLGFPKRRPLCR